MLGDPLVFVGALLLVLFGVLSWLTRRVQGGGGSGSGARNRGMGARRVVLTREHAVHVVEIAGRRLLIGTGPSGAPQVLAELGEVEETVDEARVSGGPWGELARRLGVAGGR